MITPRRTRLVRVPDLHVFRHAIGELAAAGDNRSTVILVPTLGARRQLLRTLPSLSRAVTVATRDGFYAWLHARLPGAARRLDALERDGLIQAAARAAAEADATLVSPETGDVVFDELGERVPFRLRPGLIAEMLRFYDQLRRQSRQLERFSELIEAALGGGGEEDDRGTGRLLAQTRFLMATFRAYERRVAASGGWDEHTLRDRLVQAPTDPVAERVIVTVADWIAEPDGLFISDFDLLARMPGVRELELICTEPVLGSGFHERLHEWWPGIEEADGAVLCRAPASPRPVLEVPEASPDEPWFTRRDREDELEAIAQHIKAARRAAATPPPLARTAIVYKRPLPYLYLAADTLGAAGIAFESTDELPLAGEPFVATLDLVLDAVESSFGRDALVALLESPHLISAEPPLAAAAVRAFDAALRDRIFIGDLNRLEECAASWSDETSRPALDAALAIARDLAPLRAPAPASLQLQRLTAFVQSRMRPLAEDDPFAAREGRARTAVFDLLLALTAAHAAHHDPEWSIDDLAASVRRWVEEHTFPPEGDGNHGVQLLDDRAARYGDFDDTSIVGLVESEWPERQARNIFYSSGVLKGLGWPSEHTRRRASDARFLDLLASSRQRVAVSTVTLDDEAIVMRSMQLDEIPRARLAAVPVSERPARISRRDALASAPVLIGALPAGARGWAELRVSRTATADPQYHGSIGEVEPRRWSVSALETYLTCPFKFFAQHVLRLEEEPEDSDVMNPRQQGEFVHKVFEVFFAAWQGAGYGSITPDNLPAARTTFAEVVEAQLETLPEAEAGLERTRLLGSSAAAGLGEAVMRMEAERPTPVVRRMLEARVDGPVDLETADGRRTIHLRGKADRIDLLADGTFRVVDYKLGWPPQRARALQLPIYAIAAQQRLERETGRRWELSEAAYLAFKGPKRVVPLFGSANDRDRVLIDAQQRLAETLDAIGRGEFPPQPEDVFLCEHCSFASVCRRDYVDATAV